ncbi:MAG: hypothetical protein K6G68_01220 [Oscillospiraceae bacterium]|jgi:hypothetical protein|nr:hypothetical protein [Oscillospiraceae bacterium]MCR5805635.1 hypothetical protein [Oscillospiraceae bacterium]
MSIFSGKKPVVLPIPQGFTADDIKIESSTCTGEKTIGFYSKADRKLHYSELVTKRQDIVDFYEKYGIVVKDV